jgi:hypothetical protein
VSVRTIESDLYECADVNLGVDGAHMKWGSLRSEPGAVSPQEHALPDSHEDICCETEAERQVYQKLDRDEKQVR